jgi:hypothetical protein
MADAPPDPGGAPSGELLAELDEVLEALHVHPASVPLTP